MTPETAIQIYTRTQDPDAFKVLVESYQNLVYSVCKRILPSSADVDDAVQEVFLKLSVNASRVQDSLAPWLYACAMNTCRDVLRRNRSRKQREAEYAELVDTVRGIPDAALILSEVDRALLDLSDEDRSLVIRYYLKGETQQQIANELQVSQSTIKRKSDKAIKRMRVLLRQRGISAATAAITAALWSEVTNANVPSKLTERLANIGLSDTQQFGKQFTSASSVSLVARIVLCASAAMGLIGLWYCVPTNLVSTQVQELNLAAADSSSMQGPPPMQIEEVGAQLFYVEEHDLIDGIDFNELINQVLENHREAGHERNGPVTFLTPQGFRGQPEFSLKISIPTRPKILRDGSGLQSFVMTEAYRCASLTYREPMNPHEAIARLDQLIKQAGLKRNYDDRWVALGAVEPLSDAFTVQMGIE